MKQKIFAVISTARQVSRCKLIALCAATVLTAVSLAMPQSASAAITSKPNHSDRSDCINAANALYDAEDDLYRAVSRLTGHWDHAWEARIERHWRDMVTQCVHLD